MVSKKIATNLIKRFRIKPFKKKKVIENSQTDFRQPTDESSKLAGFGKATGELIDLKKELTKDVLDKEMAGKLLAVEGLVSVEAVFCANALGVMGIILPRRLTEEEKKIRDKVAGKVSLALLVKEGLEFKEMVGKKVVIDGEKGSIEISRLQ